jgi:hypothetical protein
LEELGSSSGTGLSAGHLENEPAKSAAPVESAPAQQPVESQPMRMSVAIVCAAVVVMVGLVAAMLVLRGSHSGSPTSSGSVAGASGADFCGVPINAVSVIYVLDRGNSISDSFDALKAACFKSLKQLGPDRKFQVIFWDRDSGSAEFPAGGMRNATAGAIEDCQRDFQDITAGGSARLSGALREAIDRKPQLIIIATAKSELEQDDAAALSSAVSAGVRIDVIQIGSPSSTAAVTDVTRSTGGHLKTISTSELQTLSKQS